MEAFYLPSQHFAENYFRRDLSCVHRDCSPITMALKSILCVSILLLDDTGASLSQYLL